MAEVENEVLVLKVHYECDDCKEPMTVRAIVASDRPLRYMHVCKNGHEVTLDERYPLIRYEYLKDIVDG